MGIPYKAFDGSDRTRRLGQLLRDYRQGKIPPHYPPPARIVTVIIRAQVLVIHEGKKSWLVSRMKALTRQ